MSADDTSESVQELRASLKSWEKSFAQAHDGRKPTREEIKQDATIAEKYRRFNRLARSGQGTHTTPRKPAQEKIRSREPLAEQTINKISLPIKEQEKSIHKTVEQEIEATPAHIRCALGPTPQKDGFVLGIFDLFNSSASPSKDAATAEQAIGATPSKAFLVPTSTAQHSRTPQSSSKRFYLDAFAGTPLKRKREEDHYTPASAKKQFATPSFLRRDSRFETIPEEHSEDLTAVISKRPGTRRGLARSFSSILANLRKQEDERMDDEWEILKELEAEEHEGSQPPKPSNAAAVIVEDSQAIEMPLGPDEALHSDEDEPDQTIEPTRKPWRKKGLKRQTKKVNMKPVLHAPQKAVVPESQLDDEDQEIHEGTSNVTASAPVAKDEGIVRKTVRKVNEAAHMNFRRLKIKNKNSKANGGSGRFGKR